MKKFIFLFFAASGIILFGCGGMGSQGGGLMSSSGRSGEVLVVCSDKQWKSVLGDSLRAVLMQPVTGLPQEEPMFLLSHVAEDYFREAYKKQRNIIYFTIDQSIEQPKVIVNYNLWAEPQLLIRLHAKNEQEAIETLSKHSKSILNYLLTSDIKRFQRAQRSNQNFQLSSEIEQLMHVSVVMPDGFIFAVKKSDFIWLRKDTKEWTQSIMIYVENYTDTNQFSNEYIVKLRNTNTQKYVFGPSEGTYAVVEDKYIPTLSEYLEYKEGYAVRTVGLWGLNQDKMGGPFVNMTILDEKNSRIVTIDGFLYAPSEEKRDLLRQLDAILLSLKFEE